MFFLYEKKARFKKVGSQYQLVFIKRFWVIDFQYWVNNAEFERSYWLDIWSQPSWYLPFQIHSLVISYYILSFISSRLYPLHMFFLFFLIVREKWQALRKLNPNQLFFFSRSSGQLIFQCWVNNIDFERSCWLNLLVEPSWHLPVQSLMETPEQCMKSD